jgi:hypothetical protein
MKFSGFYLTPNFPIAILSVNSLPPTHKVVCGGSVYQGIESPTGKGGNRKPNCCFISLFEDEADFDEIPELPVKRTLKMELFSMPKKLSLYAVLGVACVALVFSAPAKAITIPGGPGPLINFDGPAQTFNATGSASGTLVSQGSGVLLGFFPFVLNPNPQTDTISLKSPVNINSNPQTDPAYSTSIDVTGSGDLVDINGLDLDILNGAKGSIEINTIVIEISNVLLNAITIDFKADITGMRFDQTAGANYVLGGGGSGTFEVPGELTVDLTNIKAQIFGSLDVPVSDQQITTSLPLSGNWTTTSLGGGSYKLELDGAGSLAVPLTLLTALQTSLTDLGGITASFTADLNASVNIAFSYHLEDVFVIPEPSSVALLGIGLVALVPVLRRRLKK